MESLTLWPYVEPLVSKRVTLPLLVYVLFKLIVRDDSNKKTVNDPDADAAAVALKDQKNKNAKKTDKEVPTIQITPEDPGFRWDKAEPVKYRPFKKGEYKLVMGIHNISPDEWFFVENTYKDYTDLKWSYVSNPDLYDHTIFMSPDAEAATIEFYERSTQFMLQRYPMCFEVRGDEIYNKIRNDSIPLDPYSVKDKRRLNAYLSRFLEEDFIILFPDPEHYDTDEYVFKSGCFAFAAGFDPAKRFLNPLTMIHGPVPEYKTKLKPQMNKFFDKLKPNTFVRRNNWSIQTHNKVFVTDDNKGVEGEEIEALKAEDLDFGREVFFRSERQILTKLPKTGAIIFSIRTYLTPIKDIRDEGLGDELVGGIEGMQEVIGHYKKRPAWGEPVCDYLKGYSDGCEKPEIKGLQ